MDPHTRQDDVYARAAACANRLEAVMRGARMWPGDAPEGEVEVLGAFGCESMTFEQWLAWALIPRLRSIVAERGEFPEDSEVAAYAIRALDGRPAQGEVHDALYASTI